MPTLDILKNIVLETSSKEMENHLNFSLLFFLIFHQRIASLHEAGFKSIIDCDLIGVDIATYKVSVPSNSDIEIELYNYTWSNTGSKTEREHYFHT